MLNTKNNVYCCVLAASQSEADAMLQAMMEANLSSEVAIGVLDIITLYTVHFKVSYQLLAEMITDL